MTRDDWKVIAGGTLFAFLLLCGVAFAQQEVDCAYVRAKVAEHGKVAAYAWAIAQGYSPREIARIRRKCGI